MTHEASHSQKPTLKNKFVRATGAVGVAAAIFGAGVGTATVARPAHGISKAEVVDETLTEQEAATAAAGYANLLQTTFNGGGNIANVKVLNGAFEEQYKNGTFAPTIKDPIILSLVSPEATPDKDGNFLNGGWLGLQGVDSNGKITITPVPFDSQVNRFTAYNPDEIVFANIGVYSSTVGNNGTPVSHELIAYDLDGNTEIQNPDHSIVSPGLDVVQK